MVDQKKRWFYTINPHFFQVGEKWLTRKKIRVWRTTFLEPLFYTFPEMRSQNKRSTVFSTTRSGGSVTLLPFLATQWISLLYRRVQKIDEIQPDHCDIYQKNHNKKCNWMALVSYIGFGGNIGQISLKCRKSLNLIKLLKSWQFIISLKTFRGLIYYFK